MIYLSTSSSPAIVEAMTRGEIGYVWTPDTRRDPAPFPIWAADNACYSQGERFDLDRYLAALARHADQADRCLFATAPDVVGDAVATNARSLPVLPEIRARGYRAALVLQDGHGEAAPVPWTEAEAVFVGGSTEWKLGRVARDLVEQARARGLWAHMGRVNSYRRLRYAEAIGCDSADGTFLAFGPDVNLARLREWQRRLATEGALF